MDWVVGGFLQPLCHNAKNYLRNRPGNNIYPSVLGTVARVKVSFSLRLEGRAFDTFTISAGGFTGMG